MIKCHCFCVILTNYDMRYLTGFVVAGHNCLLYPDYVAGFIPCVLLYIPDWISSGRTVYKLRSSPTSNSSLKRYVGRGKKDIFED